MAEVGGVGGSQQTQQTNNEASRDLGKLESKQDARALDAQLDAQHARQSEDAARQLGLGTSFSAIVAQLNQLQMSPQTGGQQDYREIAGPGNGQIAEALVNSFMAGLGSSKARFQSGNELAQDQGQQEAAGMGSIGGTGNLDEEATMNVVKSATAGVYGKLYDLVKKMKNVSDAKRAIGERASMYSQILSNWGADKNAKKPVPTYEFTYDKDSGEWSMKPTGKKLMTYDEAKAAKDSLTEQKDALSEMSTMDQLTLQQAMEQKSQFESIFSNMLKTFQQTSQGVIGNLK